MYAEQKQAGVPSLPAPDRQAVEKNASPADETQPHPAAGAGSPVAGSHGNPVQAVLVHQGLGDRAALAFAEFDDVVHFHAPAAATAA